MTSWSTDAINERERFSYWREVVCQSVFNISPERAAQRFSARINARSSGQFRFATCESTGYEILRTARDINRAPADHFMICLQLQGQTFMRQGDRSFGFARNDMCISDGRRPFSAECRGSGLRAMAVVPHAMIHRRAPWLRDQSLTRFDPDSPFFDLARRHLVHLMSDDLSEIETSLLTDNLCNLLALISAPEVPVGRLQPELQLEAMLAFARQNLHRCELSPHDVAAHLGISVRTLHLRFKALEKTFGRWVLESRLAACSKALRDPHQKLRGISEIAYSCGFNDLSHFNKAFRAYFGMTPGEWRSGLLSKMQ
ncbi:MAG TPA: helix-turn-helix domain-containing protein [Pseudolabrys sp.]|nr:helix-turn-helix domain-containing protein [Pseudolabrys sp.]